MVLSCENKSYRNNQQDATV